MKVRWIADHAQNQVTITAPLRLIPTPFNYPNMTYHRRLFFIFSLICGLLAGGAHAEENTTLPLDEKAILLPQVTISEKMKLRPEEKWLIGEFPGLQIFSNASEKQTRGYVNNLYEFHQAFTFLFPKSNILGKTHLTLILCNSSEKFSDLANRLQESLDQAQASKTVSEGNQAYILVNLDVASLKLNTPDDQNGATDAETGLTPDDPNAAENIEPSTLVRLEYLHFLLSRNQPRSPAWLEEGVARLFAKMDVEDNTITYAAFDKDSINFFRKRALLPLQEMLAVTYDSPEFLQSVGSTFSEQSLAFVHYGMFAFKQRYRKSFFELIDRAAREPITEPIFKETFGTNYKSMQINLRSYVQGGLYTHLEAPMGFTPQPTPTYELRSATDAEMGRIKGEVLRLNKRYDDARIEFVSPIMRKHSDARLLASLGILDYEEHNLALARKYLEGATAAKVNEVKPYITLAKLRLEEALANDPKAQLTPAQLRTILTPLFAARALNQPQPEIYSLIADAWGHAQLKPTQQNLDILDEGVLAFPRDHELLYKTAALKAQYGFNDDARAMVDVGLKVARDDAIRARFEQLKASLPPGAVVLPTPPGSKAKP